MHVNRRALFLVCEFLHVKNENIAKTLSNIHIDSRYLGNVNGRPTQRGRCLAIAQHLCRS